MNETIKIYRNNSNTSVDKISSNSFKNDIKYKLCVNKWLMLNFDCYIAIPDCYIAIPVNRQMIGGKEKL